MDEELLQQSVEQYKEQVNFFVAKIKDMVKNVRKSPRVLWLIIRPYKKKGLKKA